MKRRVSRRELRRIRKAINALTGFSACGVTQVSILLPEPCSPETSAYAHTMIKRLRKINCVATISFVLSFPSEEHSERPYEVLSHMPLATPCIRIYGCSRDKRPNLCQRLKRPLAALLRKIKPDGSLASCTAI